MLRGLIFSTFEVCSNTEGSFTCEEAEEEVKVKSCYMSIYFCSAFYDRHERRTTLDD